MGNCCLCCKCLFSIFNVLLLVVGGLMLSIGLWLLSTKDVYISVLRPAFDSFEPLLYIFIAVGAFIMFLGLWGSLGLFYGVRFTFIIYIPLLILIVAFHFFPGLFMKSQQKKMEDKLDENILGLIQNYNPMDRANHHKAIAWDHAQFQLSCCGWTGPENWKNNTFFQDKMGIYPCSCSSQPAGFQPALGVCRLTAVSRKTVVDEWPVRKEGCGTLVKNKFKAVVNTVFLVSLVVVFSEILGIGLSFYLCAGRNPYAVGRSCFSQEENGCG